MGYMNMSALTLIIIITAYCINPAGQFTGKLLYYVFILLDTIFFFNQAHAKTLE